MRLVEAIRVMPKSATADREEDYRGAARVGRSSRTADASDLVMFRDCDCLTLSIELRARVSRRDPRW